MVSPEAGPGNPVKSDVIQLTCKCSARLKVKQSSVAKEIQCPKCGSSLLVPSSESSRPVMKAEAPPPLPNNQANTISVQITQGPSQLKADLSTADGEVVSPSSEHRTPVPSAGDKEESQVATPAPKEEWIKFTCPQCNSELRAEASKRLTVIKCQWCENQVRVLSLDYEFRRAIQATDGIGAEFDKRDVQLTVILRAFHKSLKNDEVTIVWLRRIFWLLLIVLVILPLLSVFLFF